MYAWKPHPSYLTSKIKKMLLPFSFSLPSKHLNFWKRVDRLQVTFSPSLKLRDVEAINVCVTIVTLFLSGSFWTRFTRWWKRLKCKPKKSGKTHSDLSIFEECQESHFWDWVCRCWLLKVAGDCSYIVHLSLSSSTSEHNCFLSFFFFFSTCFKGFETKFQEKPRGAGLWQLYPDNGTC